MGKKLKTLKEVIGFYDNKVFLVKGNSYELKDALHELGARYRTDFGWYFSKLFTEIPTSLPEGLELVELNWDEVGNGDDELKNDDIVRAAVESKIYEADASRHQGAVGDRVEEFVTVASKREFDGAFGHQVCYTFRDERDNCYVWFTSSGTKTQFEENEMVTIKGTVKSHDVFRNVQQTVLTRVSRSK